MKIDLERQDIIDEINRQYYRDNGFLTSIITECAHTWEDYRDIVKNLIEFMEQEDELGDLKDFINKI